MRGIVFTLLSLILFGLLLFFAFSLISFSPPSLEVSKQVFFTFDNVQHNIGRISGVSSYYYNKNYTLKDSTPASNITTLLSSYENFLRIHHHPGLIEKFYYPNISVSIPSSYFELSPLSSAGPMYLKDMSPLVVFYPLNIVYGYPDWDKKKIFVDASDNDFSYIDNLSLLFSTNSSFAQSFSDNCSLDFESYYPCNSSTTHCLYLNLSVLDNSSTYNAPCDNFDADEVSVLTINFTDGNTSFTIGALPHVLNISNTNIYANLTTSFAFNETVFPILPASLKVDFFNFNVSKTSHLMVPRFRK